MSSVIENTKQLVLKDVTNALNDIECEYFNLKSGTRAVSIRITNTRGLDERRAIQDLKEFISFTEPVKSNLTPTGEKEEDYDLTLSYPIISKTQLKCIAYLSQDDERSLLSNLFVDSYSKIYYLLFANTSRLKLKVGKRVSGSRKIIRYEFEFIKEGKEFTKCIIQSFYDASRVNDVTNTIPIQTMEVTLQKSDRNLLAATQDLAITIALNKMSEYEQELGIFGF